MERGGLEPSPFGFRLTHEAQWARRRDALAKLLHRVAAPTHRGGTTCRWSRCSRRRCGPAQGELRTQLPAVNYTGGFTRTISAAVGTVGLRQGLGPRGEAAGGDGGRLYQPIPQLVAGSSTARQCQLHRGTRFAHARLVARLERFHVPSPLVVPNGASDNLTIRPLRGSRGCARHASRRSRRERLSHVVIKRARRALPPLAPGAAAARIRQRHRCPHRFHARAWRPSSALPTSSPSPVACQHARDRRPALLPP